MRPVTARQTPWRASALPRPVEIGTPGRGILGLLGTVEDPAPPGRFRDRYRLDAEGRRWGATGAARTATQREATQIRALTRARSLPAGLRPVKRAGWKVPA
jgi:hypothetical protein